MTGALMLANTTHSNQISKYCMKCIALPSSLGEHTPRSAPIAIQWEAIRRPLAREQQILNMDHNQDFRLIDFRPQISVYHFHKVVFT